MPYDWTDPENQNQMLLQLTRYLNGETWRTQDDFSTIINKVLVPFAQSAPNEASEAVKVLADAEIRNPELRRKYCEVGLLADILWRLEQKNVPRNLAVQYLRLVGNSLDEESGLCRGAVAPHIHRIAEFFSDAEFAPYAVAVIFNACAEPGPTRSSTIASGLHYKVARCLHDGTFLIDSPAGNTALALLEAIVDDILDSIDDDEEAHRLSTEIVGATAGAQSSQNHVMYARYIALVLKYLNSAQIKRAAHNMPALITQILTTLDANIKTLQQIADLPLEVKTELVTDIQDELFEGREDPIPQDIDVKLLQSSLGTNELSKAIIDMTQQEAFADATSEADLQGMMEHVTQVLEPPAIPFLEVARITTFILLANLAARQEVSVEFVSRYRLQDCMLRILKPGTDRYLLLAATQCLFRLAFAEPNRDVLGQAGILPLCVALLRLKDPRLQPEAAAVLRVLVSSSVANADLLLASTDDHTRKLSAWDLLQSSDEGHQSKSLLALILEEYARDTELADLGILVVEMIKVLSKESSNTQAQGSYTTLITHSGVTEALFKLMASDNSKYPFTRGMFGFGVLSQSDIGAISVVKDLNNTETHRDLIERLATSSVDKTVRTNLRTSLHGLKQNASDHMSDATRSTVDRCWAVLTNSADPLK